PPSDAVQRNDAGVLGAHCRCRGPPPRSQPTKAVGHGHRRGPCVGSREEGTMAGRAGRMVTNCPCAGQRASYNEDLRLPGRVPSAACNRSKPDTLVRSETRWLSPRAAAARSEGPGRRGLLKQPEVITMDKQNTVRADWRPKALLKRSDLEAVLQVSGRTIGRL